MSAFNWIEFRAKCPVCNHEDKTLKSQTHVASSYDGDDNERFHDHVYTIGQKMRWFSEPDNRFADWKQGNYIKQNLLPDNKDIECCYTTCTYCNAQLYAVVEFENCIPFRITQIGLEENWPKEFYK